MTAAVDGVPHVVRNHPKIEWGTTFSGDPFFCCNVFDIRCVGLFIVNTLKQKLSRSKMSL